MPTYLAENPTRHYNFQWKTNIVCPGGGNPTGGPAGGMGGGWIFIIILICVSVVYVIGGIVFLKFVQKKEGSEIVPNKDFWMAIPGLVKVWSFYLLFVSFCYSYCYLFRLFIDFFWFVLLFRMDVCGRLEQSNLKSLDNHIPNFNFLCLCFLSFSSFFLSSLLSFFVFARH
jgi:hypothetical protein